MNKLLTKLKLGLIITLCTMGSAVAGLDDPVPIPEPSILGLIAAAAVAFIILKKGKK
ncbi:MAG: PEP-CTERM sorting domain-containing protein [Colwellia sp.]|nr:PEP-CTERM sorting domain-containing protein [Colwellia sp.]